MLPGAAQPADTGVLMRKEGLFPSDLPLCALDFRHHLSVRPSAARVAAKEGSGLPRVSHAHLKLAATRLQLSSGSDASSGIFAIPGRGGQHLILRRVDASRILSATTAGGFQWGSKLEKAGTVLALWGPCVSGKWRQFTHWEAFSRHVTVELCRYIDKHFPAVTASDHRRPRTILQALLSARQKQ